MGWSLGGILKGAARGVADWAERGQAADIVAERDARTAETQRELERVRDGLLRERELSTADLRTKLADQERSRRAEVAGEAATYADGVAKRGTKDWYLASGEFLRGKGDAELAQQDRGIADKFDDNAFRREQLASNERLMREKLSSAAAARRGGGTGDEDGAGVPEYIKASAERNGISGMRDKDGNFIKDPNAHRIATRIFSATMNDEKHKKDYPDVQARTRAALGFVDTKLDRMASFAQQQGIGLEDAHAQIESAKAAPAPAPVAAPAPATTAQRKGKPLDWSRNTQIPQEFNPPSVIR